MDLVLVLVVLLSTILVDARSVNSTSKEDSFLPGIDEQEWEEELHKLANITG
jgi:hypothetical protein